MEGKIKGSSVYVFIDASNIIYGCKDAGWKMDFKKLIHYLRQRFRAQRIIYYAGKDAKNGKQAIFYDKLNRLGYELKLVSVKTFRDGSRKADVDARLVFEAMRFIYNYESAIFLTGDGDYYWLLEYLLKSGKKIKLFGHRHSTAKELKKLFGEKFNDIGRIREVIEYKKMR
jgi:uncharacterized LabA/DUF88 family protein